MTAINNEGIYANRNPCCPLCLKAGKVLHPHLRDHLFGSPGEWSYLYCTSCNLMWLDPCPVLEDICKLYVNYYTHGNSTRQLKINQSSKAKNKTKLSIQAAAFGYEEIVNNRNSYFIGNVISKVSLLRELAGSKLMWLKASWRGTLLDVGCGSGYFLSHMRDLGWKVVGVEPDVQAAQFAKSNFGLDVYNSTIEEVAFPDNTFEAITLNHVIEHVKDPQAIFEECRRILKKDGKLIVATPNIDSLGYNLFRNFWLPLDVPRHLQLFSLRSIQTIALSAGLHIQKINTTATAARNYYYAYRSFKKYNMRNYNYLSPWLRIKGHLFWIVEHLLLKVKPSCGEEIVMIGRKE